jgi:hypothetical protein
MSLNFLTLIQKKIPKKTSSNLSLRPTAIGSAVAELGNAQRGPGLEDERTASLGRCIDTQEYMSGEEN